MDRLNSPPIERNIDKRKNTIVNTCDYDWYLNFIIVRKVSVVCAATPVCMYPEDPDTGGL